MLFKKRSPTPPRRAQLSQRPVRSGAVFSYHANRSVREGGITRDATSQQPDAVRRSLGTPWKKRLPTIGALLAILIVTVSCLQLSSNIKVVTLGTDASHVFLREQSVYTAAAQQAFKSLLNGNKLTVNTQKISTDLQRQFPELKAVSVSLPVVGNRPIVYIQPTIPELILVSSQGMFLLDSNGRALITGNQVTKLDELDVPVVTDESNLPIEVGKVTLPRSTTIFIKEVFGQLKAKGLRVTSLALPPGSSELHARIQGAGYLVKFNLHGNAREEAGTFLAVKAQLEKDRNTAQEYIDVRVENKAYYR